jgi:hypothetical protein
MKEVLIDFLVQVVQGVLLAFLPILATMVTSLLIVKAKSAWLQFKDDQAGWAGALGHIAEIAVKAAEQANLAGLIEDKKSYAVQTVQIWLNDKGIKLDISVIEAAIEAAVFDEFGKNK